MRRILITAIIILVFSNIFADYVAVENATNVAKNLFIEKRGFEEARGLEISEVFNEMYNTKMLYYFMNYNKGGFVIIAADDAAPPVLGYCFNNEYGTENHPPQFDWLMNLYREQMMYIIDNNLSRTEQTREEWLRFSVSQKEFQPIENLRDVEPLITSQWNQNNTWNQYCPADPLGPGGHTLAGCVAVAMAQVMNYWEHPSQGSGSHSYYHPDYGNISANFENTTYNWNDMLDNTTTNSSRELLFHCGVGVNMNYGPFSSGAYSSDVGDAMEDFFYYNSYASFKSKSSFSNIDWENMIIEQLDNAFPLYYRGQGTGGHAFILDGYQNTNHFHFNWGWSGGYDGYYYLTDLTPGPYNFTNSQWAYFNLIPAAAVNGSVTLMGGSGNVQLVDIVFENLSIGGEYTIHPDADGIFNNINLPTGSYRITYSLAGYHDYVIYPFYINANSLIVEIPNVDLIPIMNGVIFVNQDGSGDFTNISYAVQAVDESAIIYVYGPDTYTGENNRNIYWNGNQKHICLFGLNNPLIVCTEEGSYVFKIINGNEDDVIRGFEITNNNYDMGSNSAIIINGGSPIIRDNYIYDWISCAYAYTNGGAINITYTNDAFIYNNTFENVRAFFGGAISCSHSTLEISNNSFINNTSWYDSQGTGYAGTGGALDGVNCTINLHDNTFSLNESYNGGAAVDLSNCTSTSIIQKNTFSENVFVSLEQLGQPCSALRLECSDIDVSYNKFINNHQLVAGFIPALYMNSNNNVFNNTFIGNDCCIYNEQNSNVYNCIFANNDFFGGGSSFEYCLEYNTTYQSSLPEFGEGCLIGIDPQIDNNYQPVWNTTIMSPCIDTGDPASPFDPDDTPADIGAVRAVTHDFHLTTAEHDRYRYRSVPVIDRDYMQQGFETTYICAPVEEQTEYFRIFDRDDNEKEWLGNIETWMGNLDNLDSVKGYKLQTTSDVEIPTSGRTLAENTQVDLVAGENWVGYFVKKSMGIQEVFQDIWAHVESIYSEDWAWASPGIPPERCVLIYGKMYIVRVDQACSFVYGDGTPVPPEERGMTEGFYYVEAPTYSPINIESLDDSTVVEVGVFMDGECIGATQVEEFPLQILAFAPEGSRGSGDITFDFYYGGRSYKHAQDYKVLNKETGQYVSSKIKLRPYEFTTICFGNPPTPPKFTLSGNYPNPFNPTTTISYSIPSDGNVELIVYNIRGQKVKTLISGTQPTGVYNVTWNGKDENDRSVSSGVYLYKLRSSGKTAVKKMLLLK